MNSQVLPKIDVHHHIIPEFYSQIWESLKIPAGTAIPKWSLESSETLMSKLEIGTAILSLSAPGGIIAGPQDSVRSLVRKTNDYANSLRATNLAKFGFFASLPSLVDLEGTLAEIDYAFEHLQADGVTLFTSYQGQYLGAEGFRPVWSRLNQYKAVVHVHPIHSREAPFTTPFMPQPLIDYPHETARTASDLVLSGRKRQSPDCKIILSHAGGTFPILAQRLTVLATTLFKELLVDESPRGDQILEDAKSFYFDLALGSSSNVLDMLVKWAPPDHILYGSDYPYARGEAEYFDGCLRDYDIDNELRKQYYRDNALKLFPRLWGLMQD